MADSGKTDDWIGQDLRLANPGDVVEIGKPVLIMLTETEVMAFDFGTDNEPVAAVEVVAAPVEP